MEKRACPFEAKKIIKEVSFATSNWQELAKKHKVKKVEIDKMSSAFEHEDLSNAQKLQI